MLILGSQSRYRKGVLEELGLEFKTMSADIDEKAIRDDDPKELVIKLARAKNDALKNKIGQNDILITSDQVTVYKGNIREKPISQEEGYEFLKSYSNSDLSTYTSLVVFNKANGKQAEDVDIVPVYFNEIPEQDIQTLIHQDNILNIGGGFLIEDPILLPHVKKIDGDIKSVMAMPPKLLKRLLEVEN